MKITVVGTGYVGLVTGTCFAESGNEVVCVDIDEAKIQRLRRCEIPIYEPGLRELVERNSETGRLKFSTDLAATAKGTRLVFLAVGTPSAEDGSADLSSLWAVVDQLAPHMPPTAIVVTKSTVPVGTNSKIHGRLKEQTGRDYDVASNPEFLKEGAAIEDFMKPDRVVVGVRRVEVAETLRELVLAVFADGEALFGDVARKCGNDQVRGQRAVGHQDQLHQRSGQPVRTDGGRHQ